MEIKTKYNVGDIVDFKIGNYLLKGTVTNIDVYINKDESKEVKYGIGQITSEINVDESQVTTGSYCDNHHTTEENVLGICK